jgi:hypothetical protein
MFMSPEKMVDTSPLMTIVFFVVVVCFDKIKSKKLTVFFVLPFFFLCFMVMQAAHEDKQDEARMTLATQGDAEAQSATSGCQSSDKRTGIDRLHHVFIRRFGLATLQMQDDLRDDEIQVADALGFTPSERRRKYRQLIRELERALYILALMNVQRNTTRSTKTWPLIKSLFLAHDCANDSLRSSPSSATSAGAKASAI